MKIYYKHTSMRFKLPEFNFGDRNSFHQIFLWKTETLICLVSTYLDIKKPCVEWFITSHRCWKLLLIYHLLWMYICMIKLVALLGIIKGLETPKKNLIATQLLKEYLEYNFYLFKYWFDTNIISFYFLTKNIYFW